MTTLGHVNAGTVGCLGARLNGQGATQGPKYLDTSV